MMAASVAPLYKLSFDRSRPLGKLDESDCVRCTLSNKMISFDDNGLRFSGYAHAVQLSKLQQESLTHVMSFELRGMVQEYGFNAIAIVLSAEDVKLRDLGDERIIFGEVSQTFAPFASSWITLQINMASSTVTLFAEAPMNHAREEEKPGWYHATKTSEFTKLGEQIWSKVYTVPKLADGVPRVGLMLSGFLPNVATIINPRQTRAIAHIDADAVVYG